MAEDRTGPDRDVAEAAAETRRVVQHLFDALKAVDLTAIEALIDDDVDWWVCGGELWPGSGSKTKREFIEIARGAAQVFPAGLTLHPTDWIVEGHRAAVEVRSDGLLADGRRYANQYHFAFKIRNGRVVSAREYMDTLYARSIFAPVA